MAWVLPRPGRELVRCTPNCHMHAHTPICIRLGRIAQHQRTSLHHPTFHLPEVWQQILKTCRNGPGARIRPRDGRCRQTRQLPGKIGLRVMVGDSTECAIFVAWILPWFVGNSEGGVALYSDLNHTLSWALVGWEGAFRWVTGCGMQLLPSPRMCLILPG